MIKHILLVVIFSIILLSCKTNTHEKIIKPAKTENAQSRYCLINDIRIENKNAILLFDLIGHKKDSLTSKSKIIELPNGFYFSNNETKLEAVELDSNSVLIMQTFSFNDDGNFKFNEKVKLTDFINVFTDSTNSRYKIIPFRIVSTGTRIDSLFEIYIP